MLAVQYANRFLTFTTSCESLVDFLTRESNRSIHPTDYADIYNLSDVVIAEFVSGASALNIRNRFNKINSKFIDNEISGINN